MVETRLQQLESQSIFVIREAVRKLKNPAVLWSVGKDSTVLLWLCRKAFGGTVPLQVLHIDTSYKFPEMYAFRDRYAGEWDLQLQVLRNEEALQQGMNATCGTEVCCTALKTEPLRRWLRSGASEAVLVGIRGDEHGIRAKEHVYSVRDAEGHWDTAAPDPELWGVLAVPHDRLSAGGHLRVHPLLDWTEQDIWAYIAQENIPVVSLYKAERGRRYRSIGCACCSAAIDSRAATVEQILAEVRTTDLAERLGRSQDKEGSATMEKLRSLGYM